jgi:predicted small metal-binding protein
MKRFRCGDIITACPATFEGSEDEILAAVARHAHADHGVTEVTTELAAQVRGAMVAA